VIVQISFQRKKRSNFVLVHDQISRMADRLNMQNQMEHLQMKNVGVGHADTTRAYVRLLQYANISR
jgi:hypothetical protein